jgi:hypothetical protein
MRGSSAMPAPLSAVKHTHFFAAGNFWASAGTILSCQTQANNFWFVTDLDAPRQSRCMHCIASKVAPWVPVFVQKHELAGNMAMHLAACRTKHACWHGLLRVIAPIWLGPLRSTSGWLEASAACLGQLCGGIALLPSSVCIRCSG